MCPGLPQASNDLVRRAATVTCWGDGQYGGMFVAGMYAAAFFETDMRKVVESGLACVPPESDYAKSISDVLAWCEIEQDWTSVWRRVNEKWDNQDRCPYGALEPLNIDAKINGAYPRSACSTAATISGRPSRSRRNAARIPTATPRPPPASGPPCTATTRSRRVHRRHPGDRGGKFVYTEYTFDSIVESSVSRAIAMIEKTGGRREGDKLIIAVQTPRPTKRRSIRSASRSNTSHVKTRAGRGMANGPASNRPRAASRRLASAKGAASDDRIPRHRRADLRPVHRRRRHR